jgi:hypothetical protein
MGDDEEAEPGDEDEDSAEPPGEESVDCDMVLVVAGGAAVSGC